MTIHFKSMIKATVVISSLCVANQAFAAEEGPAANSGDIIVTARRVEERLIDVPISITVFNQEELTSRNVENINDVAAFTPSLSTNPRMGTENSTFTLRGFQQESFTTPSVAFYFNDVVAPRGASNLQGGEGAGPGSFFDVQSVQVLKGPQGTLFGRNTTGGAILVVPKKPQSEFGGYISGSYGNFNMFRVQGVLNVPLGEGGLRIAVDRMTRDGYQKNIGLGPSRLGNTNFIAARAGLLLKITPDIENYTLVTFSESDTNSVMSTMSGCRRTAPSIGSQFIFDMSCAQYDRAQAAGFYSVESPTPTPRIYQRQWQASNTTTWTASDSITVKNILSYGELRNDMDLAVLGQGYQFNGIPAFGVSNQVLRYINTPAGPFPTNVGPVPSYFTGQVLRGAVPVSLAVVRSMPGGHLNDQYTLTEELQLQGNSFDGRFQWIVGGYYEKSGTIPDFTGTSSSTFAFCDEINTLYVTDYTCVGVPQVSSIGHSVRSTDYESWGVFSQGTFDLTDTLSLTAGLRFSEDRSAAVDYQWSTKWVPTATNPFAQPVCDFDVPVVADRTTPIPANCRSEAKAKTSAPTWLISLNYQPDSDMLLYAKYARGYKQGMVNPRSQGVYKSFGPEELDAYEIGGKIAWGGATPGGTNLAVFYNDFKKQQFLLSWIDPLNPQNQTTGISNTASSEGYGFELDANITLFGRLKLSGAMAYLHVRLKDVFSPPGPGRYTQPATVVTSGQTAPLSPTWKGALSANYQLPVPENIGQLSVGASFQFTSSYLAESNLASKIDAFSTLNLNLDWKNVGGQPVDLSVFVNNVTNRQYYVFATDYLPSVGSLTKTTGLPRMFGMQLKYRFGADAN